MNDTYVSASEQIFSVFVTEHTCRVMLAENNLSNGFFPVCCQKQLLLVISTSLEAVCCIVL